MCFIFIVLVLKKNIFLYLYKPLDQCLNQIKVIFYKKSFIKGFMEISKVKFQNSSVRYYASNQSCLLYFSFFCSNIILVLLEQIQPLPDF